MSIAYVDTSYFIGLTIGDAEAVKRSHRLPSDTQFISSNLLEAEARSVFAREKIDFPDDLFSSIHFVMPDRRMTKEITRVLESYYLRGADLLHLATALFALLEPGNAVFATLDNKQENAAAALGFQTLALI